MARPNATNNVMESNRNRCRHTEGILLRKTLPRDVHGDVSVSETSLPEHIRSLEDQSYCIDCINGTQGRNYNESYYDQSMGDTATALMATRATIIMDGETMVQSMKVN